MSELNLLAKPFIPKSRNSYSEEELLAIHKELKEEKDKRAKAELELSNVMSQIKTYVESVEQMKQEYTKQCNVLTIRNSALQDVRDVLYTQITGLHVEIEKLKLELKAEKEKYKLIFDEKQELEDKLIKLQNNEQTLNAELTSIQEQYTIKSTELLRLTQLIMAHNYNYSLQYPNGNYQYYYNYPQS
jgi:chromosome segregation ATPase